VTEPPHGDYVEAAGMPPGGGTYVAGRFARRTKQPRSFVTHKRKYGFFRGSGSNQNGWLERLRRSPLIIGEIEALDFVVRQKCAWPSVATPRCRVVKQTSVVHAAPVAPHVVPSHVKKAPCKPYSWPVTSRRSEKVWCFPPIAECGRKRCMRAEVGHASTRRQRAYDALMVTPRNQTDVGLLQNRGGRIDPLRVQEGAFDADARVDQAIAESFPASDPPSWNSGLDKDDRSDSTRNST